MPEINVIEEAPGRFAVYGAGQYQPFDPDHPGFVPMTRERAEEVAAALREALTPREE
jgi:hypothetical protein